MHAPRRVILDTDIGTDIDDAMALLYAMRQPAIALSAVTTVSGNAVLRARIARKMLHMAGHSGIPVVAGLDEPLLRARKPYLSGHEGEGFLEPTDKDPQPGNPVRAPHFLAQQVLANPEQIDIVAIGPLTNLATALLLAPEMATAVRSVVVMGGHVFPSAISRNWSPVEHNIASDPEAARIVLSAGWDVTLVPLEVTTQVLLDTDDRQQLCARKDPLYEGIVRMLDRWLAMCQKPSTPMHDPLAMIAVHDRSPFVFERIGLHVLTGNGQFDGLTIACPNDPHRPTVWVPTQIDGARAKRMFLDTIL